MAATQQIKGLKELNDYMQKFPAKLEANVMRAGMGQGAKVIMQEVKQRVPVGKPSSTSKKFYGGYMGALRDSIRKSTSLKFGRVIASIKAGGKNKKTGADVYYAHMVEWGTAGHAIKGRKGGKLKFGSFFGTAIFHRGARPKPFMRPALDMKHGSAIVETARAIRKRLEKKHGLDQRHIKLEGDE